MSKRALEICGWVVLIEIMWAATMIVAAESRATPWLNWILAALHVGCFVLGGCVGKRIREWRNQW